MKKIVVFPHDASWGVQAGEEVILYVDAANATLAAIAKGRRMAAASIEFSVEIDRMDGHAREIVWYYPGLAEARARMSLDFFA